MLKYFPSRNGVRHFARTALNLPCNETQQLLQMFASVQKQPSRGLSFISELVSENIWKQVFYRIDVDHSGTINMHEMLVYLSTFAHVTTKDIQEIYNLVTSHEFSQYTCDDNDHGMTLDEFLQYTKNVKVTQRAAKILWESMDYDRTGSVTVTEFARAMTNLGTDQQVEQIFEQFDIDGNATFTREEFLSKCVGDVPDINEVKLKDSNSTEKTSNCIREESQRLFGMNMMKLHWKQNVERPGLGRWLKKADHIALTVKDVARSAKFYRDILGLQQINRPDFDRAGAWFTMGNVELHLIKGPPTVPTRGHLIVPHIALEVSNTAAVHEFLKTSGVEFEINVSVPKGVGEGIVTQFFLVDPDGYRLEICNCGEVLEEYCLSDENNQHIALHYFEGVSAKGKFEAALQLDYLKHSISEEMSSSREDISGTNPVESTSVCALKLKNLLDRRDTYGCVTQIFSDEEIEQVLAQCDNDIPRTLLKLRSLRRERDQCDVFYPPAFYGKDLQECEKVIATPLSMKNGHIS